MVSHAHDALLATWKGILPLRVAVQGGNDLVETGIGLGIEQSVPTIVSIWIERT
jgi:hypothetical protein